MSAQGRDSVASTDTETARRLVEVVGGAGNVVRVTHCYSRLRLVLRDDAGADEAGLRALPGVVMVLRQGGQVQVALSSGVARMFAVVLEVLGT